jgi:hypothetical protein
MKDNFDIGITTFSLRLDFVETLIRQIRDLGIENKIILCVNGEKDGKFNDEYRRKTKISGMFGMDCDPVLPTINSYPYESFFMENKIRLEF